MKKLFLVMIFALICLSVQSQQRLYTTTVTNGFYFTSNTSTYTNYSNSISLESISPIWVGDTCFIKDGYTNSISGWNKNGSNVLTTKVNNFWGYPQDYYIKNGVVYFYSIASGFNFNSSTYLSVLTSTSANFLRSTGNNIFMTTILGSVRGGVYYQYGPVTTLDKTLGNESIILQSYFSLYSNIGSNSNKMNLYRKITDGSIGPLLTVPGLNKYGTSSLGYIPNSSNYITSNTVIGITPNNLSGTYIAKNLNSSITNDKYTGNNLREVIFISSTTGYALISNINKVNTTNSYYYYIIKTTDAGNNWSLLYQTTLNYNDNPIGSPTDRYDEVVKIGGYTQLKQDRKLSYLLYFANTNQVISIDTRTDNIINLYNPSTTLLGVVGIDGNNGKIVIGEFGSTNAKFNATSADPELVSWTTTNSVKNVYMATLSIPSDFNVTSPQGTGYIYSNNHTWCGLGQLNTVPLYTTTGFNWYTSIGSFTGTSLNTTLPSGINYVTVVGYNLNSSFNQIITITSLLSPSIPTISAPTTVCSGTSINITTTGSSIYANGTLITSPYVVTSSKILTAINSNTCGSATSTGINVSVIPPPADIIITNIISTLTGISSTFSVSPRSNEIYKWSTGDVSSSTYTISTISGSQTMTLTISGLCGSLIKNVNWTTYNPSVSSSNITISGTTTSISLNVSSNTSYQISTNDSWINVVGNSLNVTTTSSERMSIITISSTLGTPQVNSIIQLIQLSYMEPTISGIITVPGTIPGVTTVPSTVGGTNTIPGVTTTPGIETTPGVNTTPGTGSITGINEDMYNQEEESKIWPNPSNGETYSNQEPLKVYSLSGQEEPFNKTSNGNNNWIFNLPQGVWIIKTKSSTHRLIVR